MGLTAGRKIALFSRMSSSAWRERRDLFGVPHRCPRRPSQAAAQYVVFWERAMPPAILFGGNLPVLQTSESDRREIYREARSRRNDSIMKGYSSWKSRDPIFIEKSWCHDTRMLLPRVYELLSELLRKTASCPSPSWPRGSLRRAKYNMGFCEKRDLSATTTRSIMGRYVGV